MKQLSEYAIKAFKEGSDIFGESVTGTRELRYNSLMKYWAMTVLLVQKDEHKCTSGIGFYLKNGVLKACSGHMLPWTIEITPEIQSELDSAPIDEY